MIERLITGAPGSPSAVRLVSRESPPSVIPNCWAVEAATSTDTAACTSDAGTVSDEDDDTPVWSNCNGRISMGTVAV